MFANSCSEGAADLAPARAIKNFKLKTLEGSEIELYQALKSDTEKSRTLVAFMASWCQSCKSEISSLNYLNLQLQQSKSGKVVAIALDDTIDNLKQLKLDYAINFEILYDNQSKSRKYFKLKGFPEYLVLDQNNAPKLIQFSPNDFSLKLIGPQNWQELQGQILARSNF